MNASRPILSYSKTYRISSCVIPLLLVIFFGFVINSQAQVPHPEVDTNRISSLVNENSIQIRFDQEMSLPAANAVVIQGSRTGRHEGIFTGGSTPVIIFQSNQGFSPGEEIEVTITPQMRTSAGVPVSRPYVLRYVVPAAAGPASSSSLRSTETVSESYTVVSGPVTFASIRSTETVSEAYAVVLGDLNRDGAIDMVAANAGPRQSNVIYLNDGLGNYAEGINLMLEDNTWALALGDMDGDGDLDIVVGNGGEPNYVHINNGNGGILETRTFGTGSDKTQSVALGDLDGDGDLDIVTGNGDGSQRGQANFFYLNDGTGHFGEPQLFGPSDPAQDTRAVALGDMDLDGDLDIVTANWSGHPNTIHLNDGAGHFPEAREYTPTGDWSMAVALGDLDNDGDLDIAVGTHSVQENVVYLNDGIGNFAGTRSIGAGSLSGDTIQLGDLDGDNDLDIVLIPTGWGTQGSVAYLNNGAADFSTSVTIGTERTSSKALAIGDIDGDGVLDVAGCERGLKVFLNTASTALSNDFTPISSGRIESPTNTGGGE